ncbi:MAG: helix-turn-helix transcriptional regulator, partial [Actinomycetota bacterium]
MSAGEVTDEHQSIGERTSMTSYEESHPHRAFGQMLEDERTRRRWRQIDAAEFLTVSQSGYARWETGENRPSDDRFDRVAEYLRKDVEEIWSLIHGRPYPTNDELMNRISVLEGNQADLTRQLADMADILERI